MSYHDESMGPLATSAGPAARAHRAGPWEAGSVVARFERIARENPGAVALEWAGRELSYGQLEGQANRLAHLLVARGVRPESTVAVCVAPSFDLIVAMLAIWKAGGVYLPLDPTHPRARLGAMLADTSPVILLTHQEFREKKLLPPWPTHLLDGADRPTEGQRSGERLEGPPEGVELSPQQTAYLFYTSGTTGQPKGVAASHANLLFYTSTARETYGFTAGDTFCSIARSTFSISLFELLSPLLCGGRLLQLDRSQVVDPARLAAVIGRVTVLHAGPSLWGYLFRYLATLSPEHRSFPAMRHASTGGDRVSPETMEGLKAAFPQAELYVIYGCTEISCLGCTYPIPRGETARKSLVGQPLPGVRVRIADSSGQAVAAGEIGEILVAGGGLTKGYVNRPELTAERFRWIDGERHYATGDLARRDAAGNLEFLGRKDDQIQLHGIRIEPGEIESTLRKAPGVREAVVTAREEESQKYLVAYVVGEQLAETIPELRAFLAARLPDYMVPFDFVVLDGLPLNHNLKLDRRALPAPSRSPLARGAAIPRSSSFSPPSPLSPLASPSPLASLSPSSETAGPSGEGRGLEERVAGVFARFLGLSSVGVEDDFFDLGGQSHLALRVTNELIHLFGVDFPIYLLFQCPTARQVAELIRQRTPLELRPVPLNGNSNGPPLFVLAGVQLYRELARELEAECSVHGLSVDPEPGEEIGPFSLPLGELAGEYVRLLCQAQPARPFHLAGFSFGGILAYEVARRLRGLGREVAHLWLLDAVLPTPPGSWWPPLQRVARLPFRRQAAVISREIGYGVRRILRERRPPEKAPRERGLLGHEPRTDAYFAAARAYLKDIRPYEGATTLVVAQRRLHEDPLLDPLCGWGPHIPRLQVVRVEAPHLALLSRPHVREVAASFPARK